VLPIFASIPSPSDNAIKIGGLELRAYGLAIALGVIAAVWISRRRWAARGGDPDDISRIALWAVLAGLIGARLYHVITDHDRFEGRWLHAFAVWEGGLGIPGGLIAGVGVGAYVAHRRGLPVTQLLDVVAPALPVAQAIGRLGNWFNQELFGRPTDLPWGLEIDPAHRPAGNLDVATFHPTFLYEALWNLALAGGLVLWERHHPNARPGRLFAFYVAGYAVGRAWVEALRIDPAAQLVGVRWNIWMSAIAFVGAIGWLVFDSWRASKQAAREPSEAATATAGVAAGTTDADTADATATEEPATGPAEAAVEPAAAEAADAAQEPATETAAAADEPATETAAAADEPATETAAADEPATETAAADEPATETADAAEDEAAIEPTATETADAAEEPATETVEAAEEAHADEPATETADEPKGGAPADTTGPDAAEQADATDEADGDDVGDASDTSADTAREPAGPAARDPESDGATDAEPDAGEPTDPGASQPRDPEPASERGADTADEEAAT
jgi:prolipoprotein diacylglyceryl transferase